MSDYEFNNHIFDNRTCRRCGRFGDDVIWIDDDLCSECDSDDDDDWQSRRSLA